MSTEGWAVHYGLNGAGKSAIGEVIFGCSTDSQEFSHCRVETTGTGPFRFLVYNNNFASKVIGETMPGIFTIGELDTSKQTEIDSKEAENVELEGKLVGLRERRDTTIQAIQSQTTQSIERVWEAHGVGKNTKLRHFLVGYGRNKEKFFEDLKNWSSDRDARLDSLERLEQRWLDVSGNETSKTAPTVDLSSFSEIETDSIWSEAVEVSKSSRLAPLIAHLGNSDWVGEGRSYMQDALCPFCQQGLPHDFMEELTTLLDGGRKNKLEKIESLASTYAQCIDALEESMADILSDAIIQDTNLEQCWTRFIGQAKANLALMRAKLVKPSEAVTINSSDCTALCNALEAVRAKVEDFNQRVRDRKGEQERIKAMFFRVLYSDRAAVYDNLAAAVKPLNTELGRYDSSIRDVSDRIAANLSRLSELRRSQTGVFASVEAINHQLKELGVDSFWIAPHEDSNHLYRLARPNDQNCTTQSLSEGEKTLITFLYFMELINGTHEEHGATDVGKTIVVIDDPISSLSQNYVYDVATIIHRRLLSPPTGAPKVRQTIVLTHNLFFFHELVYQVNGRKPENAHRKLQMLRVRKSDFTKVEPLELASYANDYDALWNVLRIAKDDPHMVQVVPNTMRCILEQFFTFTSGIDDLEKALTELVGEDPSPKLMALIRYLNRGSHKNSINGPPIDWTQYDISYYLAKLRSLFRAVKHEQHFERKMGGTEGASEHAAA